MNTENKTPATANSTEEEDSLIVRFGKPYRFEDVEYTEVDMSGMEDLSAADMIAAEKYLSKSGMFSALPEMTMDYVCFIAARSTEQPIEFFKGLPPKESIKIKNRVTRFFYGEE